MHRQPAIIPPLARAFLVAGLSVGAVFGGAAGEQQRLPAPVERNPSSTHTFAGGSVTFDVEARLRLEARDNNRDFDDAINDDTDDSWMLHRFRFGVAVAPTRWLKLYGQAQDAREWDSDRPNVPGVRGTEGGDTDLRLAYLELADYEHFPLGLTLGRQRLQYGDARLVGDSRWGNFGRTFDGAKLRYQSREFSLDAFAVRPVQIKEDGVNDGDAADNFFGLYGSTEALGLQTTELYFLYRDKGDNQPDLDPVNRRDPLGSGAGPAQRIATVGTRWQSKSGGLNGWDYGLEAAFQWGEVWLSDRNGQALNHRAFAAHVRGGFTWEDPAAHPRLGLEYNHASGDGDAADGRSESFQNLFPSNHEKYGFMDEFAWRNLHNLRVQFTADVTKTVQIEISHHAFWLANASDYWFRSNGISTLRTTAPDGRDVRTVGASSLAGQEVDFVVRWNAAKWLVIDVGYIHFFAGEYLRDTGPGDDADFAYVQAALTF